MNFLKIIALFFCINLFAQETTPHFTFPKIKSSITLPVKIPLAEIGNLVNASVKDLIYEDHSYTDNDHDQFKIKVWKTRAIRLVGGTKQNLLIEVPLKIWAEKGIGTLGVYSYQNTTFETVMYFNMQLTFNNNWSIITKTSPMGFKWVTKPVLDYGKIKIPITSIVEGSLAKQQTAFCDTMDDMMAKQLNFQSYAVMAWNVFSQPFQISEEYNTWLKITPESVYITPLKFFANEIDANIGIDAYSETFTGKKPNSSPEITSAANFLTIPTLKNQFLLTTTANIPFSEATSIAKNMFLNKEYTFREGKSKITITDIKVYQGE